MANVFTGHNIKMKQISFPSLYIEVDVDDTPPSGDLSAILDFPILWGWNMYKSETNQTPAAPGAFGIVVYKANGLGQVTEDPIADGWDVLVSHGTTLVSSGYGGLGVPAILGGGISYVPPGEPLPANALIVGFEYTIVATVERLG